MPFNVGVLAFERDEVGLHAELLYVLDYGDSCYITLDKRSFLSLNRISITGKLPLFIVLYRIYIIVIPL
jgi:hypothetical protein